MANYRDSQGFWDRIRDWTDQSFQRAGVFSRKERDASLAMSMVGNVTEGSAGNALTIADGSLADRMPLVARTLEAVKPGVVVTMDKRLTPLLEKALEDMQWSKGECGTTEVPARNQRFSYYRPAWSEYRSDVRRLIVCESPQHPSRSNFYDPSDMDRYLSNMIRRSLGEMAAAGIR